MKAYELSRCKSAWLPSSLRCSASWYRPKFSPLLNRGTCKEVLGFFHAKGNCKVTSSSANTASSCRLPPFYAGAVDTMKTKDDASMYNWCTYLKSQLPYLVTIPVYFIIAHLLFCISLRLAIANLNKTFILLVCTKFFRMSSIKKCWYVQTGDSAEDVFIWKESISNKMKEVNILKICWASLENMFQA